MRAETLRLFVIRLALLFVLQGCAAPRSLHGKVVRIADGDTVTLLLNGREEVRIRLYGIDCPESAQPWGNRAKQFTGTAAFGKLAQVEVKDTDRYGRPVGLVRIQGRNQTLNEQLVDAGLAWAYRRYSTRFIHAEGRARAAHRGLWSDPNPIAPWDFRH